MAGPPVNQGANVAAHPAISEAGLAKRIRMLLLLGELGSPHER